MFRPTKSHHHIPPCLSWPWAPETALIALSLASLLTMIALLRAYNGHAIFHWHGVTLNAVMAILSFTLKASLTSAATTCLGQWKWIIFSREKCCILDFDKIDRASRSSWGFFSVVTRAKVSNTAKFGAFVMMLAIVLDPSSQQLLQLKTALFYSEMPDAPIARSLGSVSGRLTETGPKNTLFGSKQAYSQVRAEIDPTMEAFILDGLFNEFSKLSQRAQMQCGTSDCHWPNFTTAGVCYQCNDITSKLTRYDDWAVSTRNGSTTSATVSAYFLPNGAFLANLDGDIEVVDDGNVTYNFDVLGSGISSQMTGFSTGNTNETVSMSNLKTLIWSLSAVQLNLTSFGEERMFNYSWPDIPVIASECALYYCVLEVASSVTNGTLRENMTELDLTPSPDSYQVLEQELFPSLPRNVSDSVEFDPTTSVIGRTDLELQDPRNTSMVFRFGEKAVKSVGSYFQSTFQTSTNLTNQANPGSVSVTVQSTTFPTGRANIAYFAAEGLPPRGRGLWNEGQPDLWQSFGALALSMTNAIRNAGADGLGKPGDVTGQSGRQVTVYMVQWGWIALHALFIVAGVTFYIVTTVSASRAEKTLQCLAWKNSALAVMSKASELGPLFKSSDSVQELEYKAGLKTASFNQAQGARLVP